MTAPTDYANIQALIGKISRAAMLADVFDVADARRQYRAAVLLLHPDRCPLPEAAVALRRLNELKEAFEKGGNLEDDAGPFRMGQRQAHFSGNQELLEASYGNYLRLKSRNSPAALHFQRYLPEAMALSAGKLAATFPLRALPLSGLSLPQEHVNWILSRLLEACAWLSQEGFVHGGISPESVFVVPETHGIILGSFYHTAFRDGMVRTVSARYRHWYPPGLFKSKRADTATDLELCKRTAAYLLGDRSGLGVRLLKTHNKAFVDFLLARHSDAYQCYDEYRGLLKRTFDNKFHPLTL
ncbi:MAG: hypothetical protein KDC66_18455 [Phaeodactylibacter sp.]|nr:hypothetical protein [Phaeodactylibacter sp.]MCB9273062.1 hypothetical protein [Lewinellaceae bacterium]